MNLKNVIILIFHISPLFILINCNTTIDEIQNDSAKIEIIQDTINTQNIITDTISLIKGQCFLLTNLSGTGQNQQQYKRLISFHENENSCSYKIINATYNIMLGDREIDGRSKGIWKLKGDKLSIIWNGYYVSRSLGAIDQDNDMIEDEKGVNLKLRRKIIGEYKIQITRDSIFLIYQSEKITEAEIDPYFSLDEKDSVESFKFAYNLPYNDNLINLQYRKVECINAEEIYLQRDFIPVKNEEDIARDKRLKEYNIKHTCSDQNSFNIGYDLARENIGRGLLVDEYYLYKIASASGYYNFYCFSKGVNQYIQDNR